MLVEMLVEGARALYGFCMGIFSKSSKNETRKISPSWIAWPTLVTNGTLIKSAGVTHYEANLKLTVRRFGKNVMAELRIQKSGKYEGAVGVFVGGRILGHLPSGHSKKFHPIIEELELEQIPATCRAELEFGDSCDVWLDATPRIRQDGDPFLPYGAGFEASLFDGHEMRLDEELHSKAKNKTVVKTGTIERHTQALRLLVDGIAIGELANPVADEIYKEEKFRMLSEVQKAGFPLTCRVRIVRAEERPLRVMADF